MRIAIEGQKDFHQILDIIKENITLMLWHSGEIEVWSVGSV